MIGNDYDIPVMYQDLGTYSMNPFGVPNGGGMMMPGMYGAGIGTSYLGGVTMAPQLEHDKVELMNRKDKEGNKTLKNIAKALGVLLLIGYVPYFRKQITKAGGIGKYLSNGWKAFTNSVKNTFSPQPKLSRWQRFKNWFNKTPHTNPPGQTRLGWS